MEIVTAWEIVKAWLLSNPPTETDIDNAKKIVEEVLQWNTTHPTDG